MRTTSLQAYKDIKPSLGNKQEEVLHAIRQLGECSDQDISKHLNWPINCVNGRRNELLNQGRIYISGQKKNAFNRNVNVYRVKPSNHQLTLL